MWHIPGSVPVEALRIPQHGAHAIRNRVANEGSPVEMRSWISREGVAGSDVAAIGSDPRDRRAQSLEQLGDVSVGGDGGIHVSSRMSAFSGGRMALLSGASGGTPNMRSALPITVLNTGAATLPP